MTGPAPESTVSNMAYMASLMAGLVFMIFKGISEFLGGGAEGDIDAVGGDGNQHRSGGNTKNCCRFHE